MKLFVLLIGVLAFTVLNVHGGHINSTLTHRIQSILAAEQFTDIPLNDTPSSPPQAVSDIEMQAERIVHRRHAPMSIKKKVVAVIFAFLLSVSSLYLLAGRQFSNLNITTDKTINYIIIVYVV
ncbi:unnamed protein product [Meloidogyne enterolobii]|uniref:Uncharacterized protein n=2 Tax=Meloidogyne enterolobii TaxID=390850 RepID=A0ACB1AAX4_MELEN